MEIKRNGKPDRRLYHRFDLGSIPERVCEICFSEKLMIGKMICIDGRIVYPFYCESCGKIYQAYAKKDIALKYEMVVGKLREVDTAVVRYKKSQVKIENKNHDIKITPIETVYKGYRFRSRLEARWAIYLDHAGWVWEYEPQGYTLSNGKKYLPDFLVSGPEGSQQCESFWLEVKAQQLTDNEYEKCKLLREGTGLNVIFAIGTPNPKTIMNLHSVDEPYGEGLSICAGCAIKWGRPGFTMSECEPNDQTIAACDAARAARFEFGENGEIPVRSR